LSFANKQAPRFHIPFIIDDGILSLLELLAAPNLESTTKKLLRERRFHEGKTWFRLKGTILILPPFFILE
jgi:hypothetical protein